MQYQIKSDNIDLSPSMENLAKEKFERIERRFENIPEGSKWSRIVMNAAPDETFEVRATINVDGKEYFSDEVDFSLEGALIKTAEELSQMIEKDKDLKLRKDTKEEELLQEVAQE